MGTRSTIALEYADGTVDQIYCHWDGYLEHNGMILAEQYTDPFKVQELMEQGDLSILDANIGTQHAFGKAPKGECTFYGRDRGESDVAARRYKNLTEFCATFQKEEFNYLPRRVEDKPVWYVNTDGNFWARLSEAGRERFED